MADFSSLKQTIQSFIKQNGNEEITGNILQDVLLAMVSTMGDGAINSLASALQNETTERQNQDATLQGNISTLGGRIDTLQTAINGINTKLAEGYIYAGIATPSTNPGTISGKVFYIAVQEGTYTNFGGTVVTEGITILKYNGTSWVKEQVIFTDGGVFDISAYHATGGTLAKYVDLAAALDGGNNIPQSVRKGGMSIKFVQSSDNKYVQYRLMATDWSTNTDDWAIAEEGVYVENPEFIYVKTDNEDKILWAIKIDGSIYYGAGVPKQVKDYIEEKIDKATENTGGFVILNPYEGIASKVRQNAISHEHMSGIHAQEKLEKAINDGVDIICTSNYTPGVPVYPLQGFSHQYVEWEFVKDGNGNIVYEKYDDGTIKTILTRDNREFKVPALKRVVKTLTGSFSNFTKKSGDECIIADLVQLPNAEHTQYTIARKWPGNGMHINLIGTTWAESVNGDPSNTQLVADIAQYCQENGYNMNMTGFHALFGLWTIQDMLVHAQYNYLFEGEIFGTINHPGFSGMKSWYVDELMKAGPNIFKAMEVYNNGETPTQAEYSISFYDKTLMRGYKLWCLAVDDWGNPNHEYNPNNPERRGCNRMYLPADYNSMGMSSKRKTVLEAYINGSFAAAGYGTIDLQNVLVTKGNVTVSFNKVPDRTVIDIDGVRTEGGAVQTLRATATADNTFIRFEAYKGDDFLFTQPFYIKKK